MSLSDGTICKLGELLNAEEPQIAYSRAAKNAKLDTIDCCVFRNVVLTSTLRTSRAFFNPKDLNIEKNHASALLRLKTFARANDYRTCTGAKLDELYIGARKAAREISNFNDVLGNE